MESSIYLLLLISINLIFLIKCDDCDKEMLQLIKQYNPLNFTNPVVNSGTGYNDFGKYDLCLANNFKYYLNKITFHIPDEFVSDFEAYIGICLPTICYQDKKFEDWKVFINNYTKIPLENIQVIKPLEENAKHQSIDSVGGTYIAITVIVLLFTSGLINEIWKWSVNKTKLKLENSSSLSSQENLLPNDNQINQNTFINTCFNINTNWGNMFSESKPDKSGSVVYGVNTFAMFVLIILTMVSMFTSYPIPIRNPEGTLEYVRSFLWQLLFNNTYCYDVLLFTFGFYLAAKTIQSNDSMNIYAVAYKIFYKFIRWYPAYLFIFFLYWKLFVYFLDGPVSGYLFNNEIQSCSKQWPFIITLTQDFFYGFYEETNANYYCFGWSWFIAASLHYYIIGVGLIYIYFLKAKAFYGVTIFLSVLFMGMELWILIAKEFGITWYELIMKNQAQYFEVYYSKFYTRISPYLIGLLLGVVYSSVNQPEINIKVKDKDNSRISNVESNSISNSNRNSNKNNENKAKLQLIYYIICYLSGLFLMLLLIFVVYCGYGSDEYSYLKNIPIGGRVVYNFISRKAFVFALFLLMIPLMKNRFTYFGGFLNAEVFIHISKLTMTVYLIHPTVIRYILLNPRYQLYFDGWYILFYGIASIALSYLLAFLISLFFEMPMKGIKTYMKRKCHNKVIEGKLIISEENNKKDE